MIITKLKNGLQHMIKPHKRGMNAAHEKTALR